MKSKKKHTCGQKPITITNIQYVVQSKTFRNQSGTNAIANCQLYIIYCLNGII